MSGAPIVRFAPSPTGYLHLGNMRPALLNWCVARRAGGRFILRFDDTDRERSKDEFVAAAREDLAWLGIVPDLVVFQSQRLALYDAAAARLRAAGRLYPAYETADELERKRRRQLARGQPPVYDRAALALSDADRAALEAEGRRPHWRFRLEREDVRWDDGVRGPCHIDAASLSDPVLIRADGTVLYTFASVVDDIDLGATLIIRGEDHVTNTAVQIEIFRALGAEPPAFAHHNLLTAASGEGFSKREGSLSIRTLREAGYEPMAVASLVVLTGTSEPVRAVPDMATLEALVSLDKVSRSPAKFDPGELDHLNARLLHERDYAAVADRLAAAGIGGGEAFWRAVRGNLKRFNEVAGWWAVVNGPPVPAIADADLGFLAEAANLLPPEPWGPQTWGIWIETLKAATGRKGKALFRPLRLALTGREDGPEMRDLLQLIARLEVLRRLPAPACAPPSE